VTATAQFVPSMIDSSTPITVTIGGIRLQPQLDPQDKKLGAIPVLNVAVSIDSAAGSLSEGKRFCSRLQQLMNNPALLDKADRILQVSKTDQKAAAAKAASTAALYKKK
jgi:hypothetical protein